MNLGFSSKFLGKRPRRQAAHKPKSGRHSRSNRILQTEWLEDRSLLSAASVLSTVISPSVQPLATSSTVVGLTASQVETAYSLTGVTGSSGTAAGTGQTIAIIDAYNDPNIKSDLATFDSKMGLPAANLTVVNQNGGTALPATNAGWDMEISLDAEWAHAIAPGANILLVEANSDNLNDLLSAVNYARDVSTVSVVSMSWGSSEFMGETQYDSYFTTPAGHIGISFVASSGDSGSPGLWPALSTNVLAVGGTTLNTTSTGTYVSETAWSDSGGGTSVFEAEPSYQTSVQSTGARTSPDVSYDANPNTGYAIYDSVAYDGSSGWTEVGGTSAGAPQWSAIVAIADQGRVAAGESTLNGAQSAIYSLPASDFHDITSGSNGGYSATVGYDEVTGRGTPIGSSVIAGLEAYTGSSSSTPSGGSGSSGLGSSGSGSTGSGGSGSSGSGSHGPGGFGGHSRFGGNSPYSYFSSYYFGGFGYSGYLVDEAPTPAAGSAPATGSSSVLAANVSSTASQNGSLLSDAALVQAAGSALGQSGAISASSAVSSVVSGSVQEVFSNQLFDKVAADADSASPSGERAGLPLGVSSNLPSAAGVHPGSSGLNQTAPLTSHIGQTAPDQTAAARAVATHGTRGRLGDTGVADAVDPVREMLWWNQALASPETLEAIWASGALVPAAAPAAAPGRAAGGILGDDDGLAASAAGLAIGAVAMGWAGREDQPRDGRVGLARRRLGRFCREK